MKLARRQFLRLAAGVAALPAVSRIARAQAYPTRPVRVVVGNPVGSATDSLARVMSQWLSERLGRPFFVENRPGAGSNIATEAVAHAPPDGYTLLLVGATNATNATLYERLNFIFIRDIGPVAGIMRAPFVMEVTPSFRAQTVPEFIAYAKANPRKTNMASAGIGSANQIFGELFKSMTGIDMVHVPYRGDLFPDLIAGQVQVYFGPMASSIGFIRAEKVRALAVTTATRWEGTPDIPTRDREVGQGDPSGQHQGGVSRYNGVVALTLATRYLRERRVWVIFDGSTAERSCPEDPQLRRRGSGPDRRYRDADMVSYPFSVHWKVV